MKRSAGGERSQFVVHDSHRQEAQRWRKRRHEQTVVNFPDGGGRFLRDSPNDQPHETGHQTPASGETRRRAAGSGGEVRPNQAAGHQELLW
jgi:hypothetical protein